MRDGLLFKELVSAQVCSDCAAPILGRRLGMFAPHRRFSFAPARLSDDEIAIATCLESMARYLETGNSFYGLAEAS
jgi:hypothetical protein